MDTITVQMSKEDAEQLLIVTVHQCDVELPRLIKENANNIERVVVLSKKYESIKRIQTTLLMSGVTIV